MATPSVLRMPAVERVTPAEMRGESSSKANTASPGLDELLYATAHDGIGCKALASAIGVRLGRLYDAVNPHEGKPFDVRWLVPLMKAANDFSVLRWLAHACGFVIHAMPKAHAGPADLLALAGELARESGDVISTAGAVLADGCVCGSDVRAMRREIADLLERAHRMDQTLAQWETGR
jgi:hypothetical protein